MKVVILCGGFGTRLREETEVRPKPMVEIGGRPILWHIMKTFAHYGYNDFILCLGYKGDIIKNYFLNYEQLNNDFSIELGSGSVQIYDNYMEKGWNVTLADTGLHTMTGARIKRVEKYVDGDHFILTYGDGVTNCDINELVGSPYSCVQSAAPGSDPARRITASPSVTSAWALGSFSAATCLANDPASFPGIVNAAVPP